MIRSFDPAARRISRRQNREKRLSQLQARIAPPVRAVGRNKSELGLQITGRSPRTADCFRRYLGICMEDAQLAAVVHGYGLNEPALHRIYIHLISLGLDQWIRGRHVALSSIAQPEPLLFIARARQRDKAWEHIAAGVHRYFRAELNTRELLELA